eukprot:4147721-Amphidinium_carterae.1
MLIAADPLQHLCKQCDSPYESFGEGEFKRWETKHFRMIRNLKLGQLLSFKFAFEKVKPMLGLPFKSSFQIDRDQSLPSMEIREVRLVVPRENGQPMLAKYLGWRACGNKCTTCPTRYSKFKHSLSLRHYF